MRSRMWQFGALLGFASCRGQAVNWSPDPPWSHVPVTVDYSEMGPVFESSLSSAVAAWNFAAGCHVLARAGLQPSAADVVMSPYDGTACGQDASLEATGDATAGTWRCSPTRAEVHFRVMTDMRSVFVIASHELGHVLGLAHDRSDLMNPSPALYEPQNVGGSPGLMPLPSDADGAAVGKRYCGMSGG